MSDNDYHESWFPRFGVVIFFCLMQMMWTVHTLLFMENCLWRPYREEQTRQIIQKFEEVAQIIGPYPAEELAKKIRAEQLRSEP